MDTVQTELAPSKARVQMPRPLVIEIIPGQAEEGLIDVYETGSYEGKSLRELVKDTLNKGNWNLEERQIIDDIRRQLTGGKLLCRGKEIEGTVLDHAVMESTEAGEEYFYLPIRAIKPQEGGGRSKPVVRKCRAREP